MPVFAVDDVHVAPVRLQGGSPHLVCEDKLWTARTGSPELSSRWFPAQVGGASDLNGTVVFCAHDNDATSVEYCLSVCGSDCGRLGKSNRTAFVRKCEAGHELCELRVTVLNNAHEVGLSIIALHLSQNRMVSRSLMMSCVQRCV
jgi:hypothetical protein